jgi:hypothetical protein
MQRTVKHPELPVSIVYDSVPHTYTDDAGTQYTSGTTFIKQSFKPFDEAAAVAAEVAKTKRLEMDILADWKKKRDESAEFGNRVHAYAESLVVGTKPPAATTPRERRARKIVDEALVMLAKDYEFLGAEQIIFDPLFLLAGMIDLPARNRKTGALAILDWKTCESITNDNYGQMALPPIAHVRDSKVSHYALQLSLYGWILTDSNYSAYPSAGEPVECAMIHVPHIGNDPVWRPVPYMAAEIKALALAAVGARVEDAA